MIRPLAPQGGRLEVLLGGRRLMFAGRGLKECKRPFLNPPLAIQPTHQQITLISPALRPPNAGFSRRRAAQ